MRYILSIRGGGIRGIIPCCCLIRLEEQLGGLTRDHVHLCAGTSTGALLTAGVAAGIPARDLLRVYTDQSKKIFTPRGAVGEAKRVVEGFLYEPANLRDTLVELLGPAANWTINDSPLRVMISATAMNGHNWFFVKDNERNSQTTGTVKLVDAAVASACAPTYFNHWRIDGIAGKSYRFFDGGAGGTANPAYQVCVEAFEYDDFTPRSSQLVSLGTGYCPAADDAPKGLLGTVGWVTSTLVDTSEDWVDEAVERQWPALMQNFNPELPRDIDMADLDAIPELVEIGKRTAAGMDWTQILN
jgi:patatin-like phospholipase/acyl hydrolase